MRFNKTKETQRMIHHGFRYGLGLMLWLTTYAPLWAQGEFVVENNNIDDAEVLIEKNTVLTLPAASRIFGQMKKFETGRANTNVTYNLNLIDYRLDDIDPEIPAAEARRIFGGDPKNVYVAAGFGNFLTPYLDASVGFGKSEKVRAGANAYHFSSLLGPVDGRNSGSGKSQLDAFGEYFTTAGRFGATAGFQNRTAHFYGYQDTLRVLSDIEPERDSIRQSFNTIYAGFSHELLNPSTFQIQSSFDFYRFSDRFDAQELNLHVNTTPKVIVNEAMAVDVGVDLIINQRTDSEELNRNLFKVRPVFHLNKEKLQVQIGAGFAYNGDTTLTDKEFYIYPHLKAAYQVIENKFDVSLSVIGDLRQQTLRQFTEENPFVTVDLPLAHTDETLRAKLDLQISPVNNVGLKLGGAYAVQKNLYFFINDATDATRFTTIYEPENVGTLELFGEIHTEWKGFRAMIRETYFQYNLAENVAEAWHRPELYGEVLLQYNHLNKLKITLDVYHMHGLLALDQNTGNAVELDDIIDLNLNGEYAITEEINAFIAIKNLLNQDYQRYYHYPVRGLTVLLGGSISF